MSGIAFVLYQGTPLQRARLRTLNSHAPVHLIEVVRRSGHYDWGDGLDTPDHPLTVLFDDPPDDAAEEAAVIAALDHICPDVVFIMGYARRFSRAATAYTLRRGVASVLISDSTAQEGRSGRLATQVKRWMVGAHHAAFVAGTPQARQIAHLGMAEDRTFTGYDVVDNDWIAAHADAARATTPRDDAQAPFLCVSRLVWQKNLKTLIDAFAAFASRIPDSRRALHIIGYGPLQQDLQDRINTAGLDDRIRLLGGVDYRDMPSHYAGAAAFVLASRSEPWGLVVNEAMAAGLPVAVSTSVGCAEDLVQEGRNGFVFDPGDAPAMANALVALDGDTEARAAMGRASREIMADWTLETYAEGALSAARAAEVTSLSPVARLKGRAAIALLRRRRDRVRGFETAAG